MTLAPDQIAETAAREWNSYPEYKESGVEWLGEVPAHWRLERLKNAVSSVVEKRPNEVRSLVAQEHIGSETGTLRQDVEIEEIEIRDHVLFESGDILFGKLRPYLRKYWLASFEGACPTELLVLRPKTRGLDRRFLFYSVQSEYFIALSESTSYGVKMPRTSWESLSVCSLTMPSLQEQQAIASFLDRETEKVDRLIARRRRLIELLEEKKSALTSRAVTKGLDPDAPMKDSGIEWMGTIPGHWCSVKLSHIAKVFNGATPSRTETKYWAQGTVPWLSSGKVNDRIVRDPSELITEEAVRECSLLRAPRGAVIIGLVGQGKTRGMTSILGIDTCINQNLAAIVPIPRVSGQFLHYALKNLYKSIRDYGRGGNQEALNCEIVSSIRVPLPPIEEQNRTVAYLDREIGNINNLIFKLKEHIEKLREYRTALISAAVTGKIDVRDEVSSLEAAEDKIGAGEGIGHEDRLA